MLPHGLTRACHAKLNLALAVGPPIPHDRPNAGLHPICSWITGIDLADQLRVRHAEGVSTFRVRWSDGRRVDWPLERDLTTRVHRALETHVGRALPIALELEKRIPAGSGLGGGSSDAAGVLLALNELFALGLGLGALRRLGGELGSDVAFFIDPTCPPAPGIVTGLGEHIERLDRVEAELVLVCPPYGCSTPAVYRAFDGLRPHRFDDIRVRRLALDGRLGEHLNNLAPAAEAVEPRLADLRRRIMTLIGAEPHLSGSGSTLFLFGGDDLAEQLRGSLPDATVVRTRTV